MNRMEKGSGTASGFFAPPSQPAAVLDLRGTLDTLRRRWRSIVAWMLSCGLLAVFIALLIPARYVATTEVYLDPRNLEVLQNEINPVVGTGEQSTLVSQSQAMLARSTDVLKSVVQSQHLESDSDFGAPVPSLFDSLKTGLLGSPDGAAGETAETKAVRALARALTVKRTDKTFVIEIGVKTSDADKSADLANAVAEAFIEQIARSREADAHRAGDALDARLVELRARLRVSDDAVERYRREHDLLNANGRLLTEQQLGELTSQLSTAQNAVTTANARLDAIRRMRRGDEMAGDTSEAVRAALATMRATLAQAKRSAAEAAVTYGPRYPATRELAARVRTAQRQLDAELDRINRSAETDLRRAKSAERGFGEKLSAFKRSTSTANVNSIELHELERVAGSDRSIYETFLNRTKDLQQRLYLNTVNARIVTVAMPPLARAGIPRSAMGGLGLLVGLLLGIIVVLLKDQSEDRRAPAYMYTRRDAL